MLSWLENLQKAMTSPAPQSEKQSDPILSATTFDFSREDRDPSIPAVAVFDDDPGDTNLFEPVGTFLKAEENERFRIPEIAAPHADGTVIEKSGKQTWVYTYRNGSLAKSEVHDPALPGGYMVVEENATSDVIIETSLAKIIGARPEDQELLEK
jgi:hypothetical protein